MAVRKITISLEPELADQVSAAVTEAEESTSAWIADAVQAKLRQKALKDYLDWAEEEFGPIPEEVFEEVDRLWPA